MNEEEKKAIELLKQPPDFSLSYYKRENAIDTILNLIEKQKNIIDSIKRILEDEELDYCDTLDEIYHFYEEVVNNDR